MAPRPLPSPGRSTALTACTVPQLAHARAAARWRSAREGACCASATVGACSAPAAGAGDGAALGAVAAVLGAGAALAGAGVVVTVAAGGVTTGAAGAAAVADVAASGCCSTFENELGMRPVITPTPTALNTMTEPAAMATIGLTLLEVSDMFFSLPKKIWPDSSGSIVV